MSPLVITVISFIMKYGPDALKQITDLLHKKESTKEDWDAYFKSVKELSYDQAMTDAGVKPWSPALQDILKPK